MEIRYDGRMGGRAIVITRSIDSPLGLLEAFLDLGGASPCLAGLGFCEAGLGSSKPVASGSALGGGLSRATWSLLSDLESQLIQYFDGSLEQFDVPLSLRGTNFQMKIWAQLTQIPIGTTISYAELAQRVGRPGGAQAVGQANKRNPIAILVPCHRVIGADGSIGGYAGGVDRKRFLLDLEAAAVGTPQSLFSGQS